MVPVPRGFITGWSWADDETLLGEAEINDDGGHFFEKRFYVFHLNTGALRRVDVSLLPLARTEGLEVVGVGVDLGRLKLSGGGGEFTVQADLKAPVKVALAEEGGEVPALPLREYRAGSGDREVPSIGARVEPTTRWLWALAAGLVAAAFGLLWHQRQKRG